MLESLLERIDHQAFARFSEQIKHALAEHHLWLQRINLAIAARESIDEPSFTAADAHQHCHFGGWIEQLLRDETFHNPTCIEIETLHQQLHQSARNLLLDFDQNGQFNRERYAEFLDIQRLFFNNILQLLEFAVASQQQFDPLTNLLNRKSIMTILSGQICQISNSPEANTCCVALADIDHFKKVNDQFGHDVGDRVLQHTASLFQKSIRRHDSVARIGGEEFLFILPDMSMDDALQVIERVRLRLAANQMHFQEQSMVVTASFGLTRLEPGEQIETLLKKADTAMYQAKAAGRNQTCCFSTDCPQQSSPLRS
ncbi:diguanylate cyclase [Neptuniibacter halophilus]|uniref:diguanylate cyclase n=1 Tax=Neptuniibacter halophilus TaxID=651666 RepID=UPI002572E9D6|nr:diguanylate cyclase [Neptuniibacter halophilus]